MIGFVRAHPTLATSDPSHRHRRSEHNIDDHHVKTESPARTRLSEPHSSVRGGNRLVATDIDHAESKQFVEAYLRDQEVRATILGPVYFMENVLNVGFSRLTEEILANPLSAGKPLDQVTVRDIAGLAVHAIENSDRFVGERIDVVSDRVTGEQAARILSSVLGREIPYQQLPLDQVRQWAGDQIADMFQRFEDNTDFLDVDGLHARYPGVTWHSYADWARTVDWELVLRSRSTAG